LGFAIPSARVREVTDQLITKGRVDHPYIGVSYRDITAALANAYNLPSKTGAIVLRVTPGSPADQAGLREGDIILKINDDQLDEDHSLVQTLLKYKVGDQVTLTVLRDGKTITVTLTLVQRPTQSNAGGTS
jgi:S1-C subfamily serine protease